VEGEEVEMTSLAEAVAAGPVVLDGGLATLLESRGHDLSSHLWSARLLVDDPAAVAAAHRAFFDAGAQVATTTSYQASFEGLASVGLDHDAAAALLGRSVDVARRAARDVDGAGERWVAASVGPYGAALADGSEYRGDYDLDVAGLRRWHRPRLQVLASSDADVLALETIPCLAEVEALLAEVDGSGKPCWLSVTCAGTRTRAGEPADEAFAMAADVTEVFAVGVNCLDPTDVDDLVALAAERSGKLVVAYPNSGEGWDASTGRWTGAATLEADRAGARAADWCAAGVRLVGGCCRVTPASIAAIAAAVR
jgi:homocysteine S-methyltransferase